MIDAFGRMPCGEFMARTDRVFSEWQKTPDSKIYVVHYGGRYRKKDVWNKKIKDFDKTKLEYPHREDGHNWAKAIPLYLTSAYHQTAVPNLLKDKIILIDGGYRENTEVEIWLVPSNIEIPKPTPTIAEKDVKFRKDKPFRTPNYSNCYDGL